MPRYNYDYRVTELIRPTQMMQILDGIPPERRNEHLEKACLLSILYLSGARVTEALATKENNFEKTTLYTNGEPVGTAVLVTLPVLKKKVDTTRQIPIAQDIGEKELVKKYILPWVQHRIASDGRECKLFPKRSRFWAYRAVRTTFEKSPHWFRHHKAHTLIRVHNYQVPLLIQYMGWGVDAWKLALRYEKANPAQYLTMMLERMNSRGEI